MLATRPGCLTWTPARRTLLDLVLPQRASLNTLSRKQQTVVLYSLVNRTRRQAAAAVASVARGGTYMSSA